MYKKLVSAAAATGLMAYAVLPVLGATTVQITGNGVGSVNDASVNYSTETTVNQNNDADIDNDVDVDASTGNNNAKYNTGGEVGVLTGNADVNVGIVNSVNTNVADVECCEGQDADVLIEGNGADSQNYVDLRSDVLHSIDQDNDADVDNDVDVKAKTGGNNANLNTGSFDGNDSVVVLTGDSTVGVTLATLANSNFARIGGNGDDNPTASFRILGNGAGSWNDIDARLDKENSIDQDNDADVDNDVDVDAATGYNDANFNTGGEVVIQTGAADVTANVLNAVNFNSANIDCGCGWDILAKISGNGADDGRLGGSNLIDLRLDSLIAYDQDNDADLDNDLEDLDASTGKNDANSNTGDVDGSDPAIITSDANVSATVENTANSNVIGGFDFPDFEWPFDSDMEFEWDFDFSGFLGMIGLSK